MTNYINFLEAKTIFLLCQKICWGVLSIANIGREKVIPAMQDGIHSVITAIASANKEQVVAIANQHHIAKVYHSNEALLPDPDKGAVYIPLPNHLHVPRIAAGFAIRTKGGVHSPAFYTEKDGAIVDFIDIDNVLTIALKWQMLEDIRSISKETFPHLEFF